MVFIQSKQLPTISVLKEIQYLCPTAELEGEVIFLFFYQNFSSCIPVAAFSLHVPGDAVPCMVPMAWFLGRSELGVCGEPIPASSSDLHVS